MVGILQCAGHHLAVERWIYLGVFTSMQMAGNVIVQRGGYLHMKNVWLGNSLMPARPYVAPVTFSEGGRASFENVELSDGKCTSRFSSPAIQGLLRTVEPRLLHGPHNPEQLNELR